jgi:hypothetical protein
MSCPLTASCETVPVTLQHDQSGLFTNDAWLRAHARTYAEREFGTLKAERFVLWLCHQPEDKQREIAREGYKQAAAHYRIEIPDCTETCLPTD